MAELAGGQQIHDPLLNVRSADVKPRADHAALVDATNQINDNLAAAVIIDNLELANVPCMWRGNIRSQPYPLGHYGCGTGRIYGREGGATFNKQRRYLSKPKQVISRHPPIVVPREGDKRSKGWRSG